MDQILAGLKPEKRDRIINAAIEEFANYPYDKASTNNIVKKAGISKGLLFHYFDNKQALYEKLVGFVIDKLYHAIIDRIDWEQTDLFERIKQMAIVKLEVSRIYPNMFDLILKMLSNKGASKVADIMAIYKDYGLDFQKLNEDIYTRNVDYGLFRDPGTIAETINIVRWSLEKYGEEQLLRLTGDDDLHFEDAMDGMNHYMTILKKSFYK